ncbi:MAG: MFS transporter, partial [Lysinibacillus sp.]
LEETKDAIPGKLDFFGTILLSIAILGIMYSLTNVEGANFFKGLLANDVYPFLLGGLAVLFVLFVYEKRLQNNGGDPILPVTLMQQPRFLITLLLGALSGAMLAAMIFVPAFSEQVLGIAAEKSGYWMTPLALAAGLGAAFGGIAVDKRGPILAVLMSGIIAAIGFFLFPISDTKLLFVVASIVAGIGMGILLGAPLNILATEKLEENKGTALASLSLIRTLGMTIAPTIYAGFIARGFSELPNFFKTDFPSILENKLEEASLSPEAIQEMQQLSGQFTSVQAVTQNDMQQIVSQINDPTLKEAVLSSVNEVTMTAAQQGYGGLFMSAGIIAVGIIIFGLILQPIRKKSLY